MANLNISVHGLEPFFKKIEELEKVQRLIICFATLGIIIAAFIIFPIKSSYEQIKVQKSKLVKVENKLKVAQKKAMKLEKLQREWKMREAEFRSVMKALPEKKEIPGLLTSISQSGQDTGLEFPSFRPEGVQNKGFYEEIPVSMEINGKFHNLVSFFDKVSRFNRIVNIRKIKINNQGSVLKANCQAVTYKFVEQKKKKKK